MKKVLVVDDSPADLANLRTIFTDVGCLVSTASTGSEAVKKARADKPNIIFLDIVMPDMDGYEACRLLSEEPATKDIPVVFVTSKGQKADRVWGQMQGAKGYVVKPYSADQLIDQLKALA
ncbi:response regulator transcription factor [Chitinilyticum piscinae]|uniref:Response regulator n=1 Tax=Chitinilyticum piscinae TaxID=2866724 RepID=A0A8J7K121_9NEIS|nr:response regulator [Chitinilyticum piscinae]MBE9608576.1 response regulator [Chitinilyticum piscinae]